MAARQVENFWVMRFVTQDRRKMNQFEGATPEVEILLGEIARYHAVARREGAVDGEGAEIVKGFHARTLTARRASRGASIASTR